MRLPAVRRIERHLAAGSPELAQAALPRHDLVEEIPQVDGGFGQVHGPFTSYRRTLDVVTDDRGGGAREVIEYRLVLPYFAWLFGPFVRHALKHRPGPDHEPGRQPWWAPGDRLDERQVKVLGLLAAAEMCAAFINTLFTQMVHKTTTAFGVGDTGQGVAGAVVRVGIVLALPFAFHADRQGRRRVIRWIMVIGPVACAFGALAPNFPVLVGTQTLGRPLGIALDVLIAVVAAEEVPRNSRAYAVSILTMAGGIGAGMCVFLIPLTGVAAWGWRLPFAASLLWLFVAVSMHRHLPETARFEADHAPRRPLRTPRLSTLATISFFSNLFIAPASFFQNRYLDDVRHYGNLGVTLFTFGTAAPAGLGLMMGGALADRHGRRLMGAASLVIGSALLALSFAVGGVPMWTAAIIGGIVLGVAVPALTVYRTEMFPTASRGRAGAVLAASSLFGGSIGLLITGAVVDRTGSYGGVLGALALGQLICAMLVMRRLPESAHLELEDLNPEDAGIVGFSNS